MTQQIENLSKAKQNYLSKAFNDGDNFTQEYSFYLAIANELNGNDTNDLDFALDDNHVVPGSVAKEYVENYLNSPHSNDEISKAQGDLQMLNDNDLYELYDDEYGLQLNSHAGGKALLEWLDYFMSSKV